jgi:hypothetical protein
MASKQRIVFSVFLLVYLCLLLFVLNHALCKCAQALLIQGLSQATLGRTPQRFSLLLTKQSDAGARSYPGSETPMRRSSLVIAAALTLSGVAASAQSLPVRALPVTGPMTANASIELPVAAGQASYVSLSGPVRDVVVGDPSIADVSVVNDRTLIVLGKRPGVTSLLAFSAAGRALTDRQIVVSENGTGGVTIYRGVTASNYACGAQCTRLGGAAAGGAAAAAPSGNPTVP